MRTKDKLTGSQLKFRDYRASIHYKDYYVPNGKLIDDKEYDVIIHESEDSEGWCYTRYEIIGEHPELNKMIKEAEFEEALEKEIEKRENEYYAKQKEKYERIPKDVLIDKIIELEKDIKRAFSRSSFYNDKNKF